MHVYCLGVGADEASGSNFFQSYKYSVPVLTKSCKMFPLNEIFTVFLFKCMCPVMTFPQNRSMSSQGHDFFTIYLHGGRLGHVTWVIIYTLVPSPFMHHIKFGFDWPSGFKGEERLEYYGNVHVYCPRVGADEPLWSLF